MKKTGAWLARYALEAIGVKHTFGIPGVQNTELYDELNNSPTITPILVVHEGGGAFMADALSRLSESIGTLVVVPAAGLTHAASGIGEAFLDGVPMLVICGGIRTDLPFKFQLHEMDLHQFMKGLTKATFAIESHAEIVPTIFEAYRIATRGDPGPVFIELPVNLQLIPEEVGELPPFIKDARAELPLQADLLAAAHLLRNAQHPGIFVGWGARGVTNEIRQIAEYLQAPVATTLQGFSVFPADHPLHVGFSFGEAAVPAAREAFAKCDAMLAIGTRFGEIATGSFGVSTPANLVHIDINPEVLSANYPAKVGIACDARVAVPALLATLTGLGHGSDERRTLIEQIARDKKQYRQQWYGHDSKGRVNPARFFDALRARAPRDSVTVVDDGNHTYLVAELYPILTPGSGIVPTDFNAMGYSIPAAIGAKLARPGQQVHCIVGDGCFRMTCMEIVTAVTYRLGVIFFVFNDGELSQIAQAQQLPYNRKACTVLAPVNIEAVALAVGASFERIDSSSDIAAVIERAQQTTAAGNPVIVEVIIDYSKRTAFTQGVLKTNFKRFPLKQRVRLATRAVLRRITG